MKQYLVEKELADAANRKLVEEAAGMQENVRAAKERVLDQRLQIKQDVQEKNRKLLEEVTLAWTKGYLCSTYLKDCVLSDC
jgi:hypothetical protein